MTCLPPHDVLPLPHIVRLQIRKQAVPDGRRGKVVLVHKVHQILRWIVLLRAMPPSQNIDNTKTPLQNISTCRRFGLKVDTMRAVVFQASACDLRFWASRRFL